MVVVVSAPVVVSVSTEASEASWKLVFRLFSAAVATKAMA